MFGFIIFVGENWCRNSQINKSNGFYILNNTILSFSCILIEKQQSKGNILKIFSCEILTDFFIPYLKKVQSTLFQMVIITNLNKFSILEILEILEIFNIQEVLSHYKYINITHSPFVFIVFLKMK